MLYPFQGSKFYGMLQSLSQSLQSLSEIPFKIIYYCVTDTDYGKFSNIFDYKFQFLLLRTPF